MKKEEYKKLLEQLPSTPFGKALQAYLDDELRSIESVHGVTKIEEAFAKQLLSDMVKRLFYFMGKSKPVDNKKIQYT
jgi:hypothetical protein